MRALIVGGGIAGPVAAMALHRAGVESAVLEAYDGPADHAGWFLNLASNGLNALRAIGLDLTERVDGHPIPDLVFWSGRGRRLGRVRNGVRLDDGTVSECVRRSDLQRVLREEALARGVTIRYGKRLERLEHGLGWVTARFADGTQEAGDILIGADGIHSRTRQLIQPDAPPPVYTGQISVGGYSRLPDLEPTRGSSSSSSAGGPSSATWSATAARCGGSRTPPTRSAAPPSWRPFRPSSGASACSTSSPTTGRSSGGSSPPAPTGSVRTRYSTSPPADAGHAGRWS
jgi:2-polyprenyl-6-methoxyphenol hydroxylase-like FAD-dependent oxidoreductase